MLALFFNYPPIPPSLTEHLENAARTGSDFTWCGVAFGYRPERGFSVTCPEGDVIRILRAEGERLKKLTLESNHRGFLREGDVIQLPGMIPLLFKDLAPSKFRGGHRYTEHMPGDLSQAVSQCFQNERPSILEKHQILLRYHPSLGLALQSLRKPPLPMTLFPGDGSLPIALEAERENERVYLWEGDVLQLGDDPPFVYKTPGGVLFHADAAARFGRLVRREAPKNVLDLLAKSIVHPSRAFHLNENDPRSLKARLTASGEGLTSIHLEQRDTTFIKALGKHFTEPNSSVTIHLREKIGVIVKIGSDLPFHLVLSDLEPFIDRVKQGPPPPPPPPPPMVLGALNVFGLKLDQIKSERDVKSAFRKVAFQWHPDRNKDPNARKNFEGLLSAYRLICEHFHFDTTI